jgi:hypothetical protein
VSRFDEESLEIDANPRILRIRRRKPVRSALEIDDNGNSRVRPVLAARRYFNDALIVDVATEFL